MVSFPGYTSSRSYSADLHMIALTARITHMHGHKVNYTLTLFTNYCAKRLQNRGSSIGTNIKQKEIKGACQREVSVYSHSSVKFYHVRQRVHSVWHISVGVYLCCVTRLWVILVHFLAHEPVRISVGPCSSQLMGNHYGSRQMPSSWLPRQPHWLYPSWLG